jgi:hypothetical protein
MCITLWKSTALIVDKPAWHVDKSTATLSAMNRAALRLREEATLMRLVASIPTGDSEVDRELLRLAASLEEEAQSLESRPQRDRPLTLDRCGLK